MTNDNSSKEFIRFAGDVILSKVELESSTSFKVNIVDQVKQIEIYEDIFSPFITVSITVQESNEFVALLPLKGEEIVNLDVYTPSLPKESSIKGKFYIYKISDKMNIADRNSIYVIHGISYEALYDLNIKRSKSYSGKISEIAQKILTEDNFSSEGKKINVEETANSLKYVSNFWSPVKNLNYIASHAIGSNKVPSYLFFENRYGFNFLCLDSLIQMPVYQNFVKDDYARDVAEDGRGTTIKNLNQDYSKILDIKIKTIFDSLKSMNNGTYASRMFSYDFVRKKYMVQDFNTLSNAGSFSQLNPTQLYTSIKPVTPFNYMFYNPRHYASHDGYPDTSFTKYMQKRSALLKLIRSNTLEITVFGRTDYSVGQKINLVIPKSTVITQKDQNNIDGTIDRTFSGNYIITAINHIITNNAHEAVLEISKDSRVQ